MIITYDGAHDAYIYNGREYPTLHEAEVAGLQDQLRVLREQRDELAEALQTIIQRIDNAPDEWFSEECEGFDVNAARSTLAKVKGITP